MNACGPEKLIGQRFAGISMTGLLLLGLVAESVSALPLSSRGDFYLAATETTYTLGPGDRLQIDIFNVPEYSGEYTVLVDGSISLPVLGNIPVGGLTISQLTQIITRAYGEYIRRPVTSVRMIQPRPLKIAIAGEVSSPGAYTIEVGQEYPSVSDLIKLAGGFTTVADAVKVQVRRNFQGKERVFTLDFLSVVRSANLSQDMTLRDGDRIYIPTKTNLDTQEVEILIDSTPGIQATQALNIAVVGEVAQPGSYQLAPENVGSNGRGQLPRLTQAIAVAGGIKPLADINRVQVRRSTRNGWKQTFELDLLELLQGGNLDRDLILQDGDTIFVPTNEDFAVAETLILTDPIIGIQAQPINILVTGEVFRPGSYQIIPSRGGNNNDSDRIQPPRLTQAIETAGGIKPLADIRRIEVRRVASNGAEKTVDVSLWQLLQQGDLNQDLILQDGDRIFIARAEDLDSEEAVVLAEANFSPAEINVNVVGEVENPGSISVPANTPLNQALLSAGGFDLQRAKKSSVELIRLNPNGTITRRKIKVDLSAGINEENNPTMRNNDVIVVKRSTLTSVSDTLSTVLRPIGSFFSLFNFFRIFNNNN